MFDKVRDTVLIICSVILVSLVVGFVVWLIFFSNLSFTVKGGRETNNIVNHYVECLDARIPVRSDYATGFDKDEIRSSLKSGDLTIEDINIILANFNCDPFDPEAYK